MRTFLIATFAASLISATSLSTVSAQGHGSTGLSRAAHASGRSTGGAGMANSGLHASGRGGPSSDLGKGAINRIGGQGSPRHEAQNGTHNGGVRSASASGLNHSLKRAGNATPTGANLGGNSDQTSADNAAQIRDRRFEQAEHLRQVSTANGNEKLQSTADRMEASAQRNFERRQGTYFPTDGVPSGTVPGDDNSQTVTRPAIASDGVRVAAPQATSKSSTWLPSWLRRKTAE